MVRISECQFCRCPEFDRDTGESQGAAEEAVLNQVIKQCVFYYLWDIVYYAQNHMEFRCTNKYWNKKAPGWRFQQCNVCFPAHFIYQLSIHMLKICLYQKFLYLFIAYKMRRQVFVKAPMCTFFYLNCCAFRTFWMCNCFQQKSEALSLISQSAGYHLPQNTAFSIIHQVYNTAYL